MQVSRKQSEKSKNRHHCHISNSDLNRLLSNAPLSLSENCKHAHPAVADKNTKDSSD
nr:MAG TPA: hypothetical protein [Caudoviricetes sp.]